MSPGERAREPDRRERRAVCPGSYDPVTFGHLDVIGRTAALVDTVVVAVGANSAKSALFTPAERVEMLRETCAAWPGVTVESFSGLLVDFCTRVGATLVVKGVRGVGDVDYELQMAQLNRRLGGVDTVLLPTAPEWSYLSSTRVRELAALGGDLTPFLPAAVAARTVQRAAERRTSGT